MAARNPFAMLWAFFKDKMAFMESEVVQFSVERLTSRGFCRPPNECTKRQMHCYVVWTKIFTAAGMLFSSRAHSPQTTAERLQNEILYRTCDAAGDFRSRDEAFAYMVNVIVRLPDEYIDNHIKSFAGNALQLSEQSRVVSIDEFYFMHLETLPDDLKQLNRVLCEHYGWCKDFAPFPRENDTPGSDNARQAAKPKPFAWTPELVKLVTTRFSCMFGGDYGYSADPTQPKPVKRKGLAGNPVTAAQIRQCTEGLHPDRFPPFSLRLPRGVERPDRGSKGILGEEQLRKEFGLL